MKTKLFTCGTSALFAAALTLQAQTSTTQSGSQSSGSNASASTSTSFQTTPSASSTSQAGSSAATPSTSTDSQFGSSSTSTQSTISPTGSSSGFSQSSSTQPSTSGTQSFNSQSGSFSGSAAGSASGSLNTANSMNSTATGTSTQSTSAGAQFGTATNVQNSSSQSGFVTNDTQVTTFVQQLDAQGPAVVQRISTQLGDLACSQDTVENLVEALHSGKSVTITSNVNGQTQSSTFNASGAHMGYGEAYLALALAGQQLRDAGVTTCATPDQWHAVLLGGPLNVTNTSTTTNSFASASGSHQVQGIVTLRNQGQGWGEIARSTNVQLGQIVGAANVSANSSSSTGAGAPTGFSSAEMNQGRTDVNAHDNGKHKGEKKHWWSRDKDNDKNKDKDSNASSDNDSASTHADDSAKPSDK